MTLVMQIVMSLVLKIIMSDRDTGYDSPDRSAYQRRLNTRHDQSYLSRFRGNPDKIRTLNKTSIHADEHSRYDFSGVSDVKLVMTDYLPLWPVNEDQSLNV